MSRSSSSPARVPGRGASLQPRARAARDRDGPDQERDPVDRAGLPPAVRVARRQQQPRAPVRARQRRHPRARAFRSRPSRRRATSGNNQLLRYRIPEGRIRPAGRRVFSPEEITLLGLAATVWREGSLSGESRRALMKLRSLGVEADDPVVGYAPRLRVRETRLRAAQRRRSSGTRSCSSRTSSRARPPRGTRTVAPLALVQHQGRWHLQGIDQDANGLAHLPALPHRRSREGDRRARSSRSRSATASFARTRARRARAHLGVERRRDRGDGRHGCGHPARQALRRRGSGRRARASRSV